MVGVIIYFNKEDEKVDSNNEVKITDQMEQYDYYLEEDATDYYKSLFQELKNVLNSDNISMEDYAKIVAKMFVTDVFTLDNKISSNDIGGLQFVYKDYENDFIKIAQTTLYSMVESNIYNDREQELPIVSEVTIDEINNSRFNYNNNDYDSYEVVVSVKYVKDLGYPVKYKLVLIKDNKYLYVVSGE